MWFRFEWDHSRSRSDRKKRAKAKVKDWWRLENSSSEKLWIIMKGTWLWEGLFHSFNSIRIATSKVEIEPMAQLAMHNLQLAFQYKGKTISGTKRNCIIDLLTQGLSCFSKKKVCVHYLVLWYCCSLFLIELKLISELLSFNIHFQNEKWFKEKSYWLWATLLPVPCLKRSSWTGTNKIL